MAGNLFGSGDKTQSAEDNRVGLSDNAVFVSSGGFLFNPGRASSNPTLDAAQSKSNWPVLVAVGGGVILLGWFIFKRR